MPAPVAVDIKEDSFRVWAAIATSTLIQIRSQLKNSQHTATLLETMTDPDEPLCLNHWIAVEGVHVYASLFVHLLQYRMLGAGFLQFKLYLWASHCHNLKAWHVHMWAMHQLQ